MQSTIQPLIDLANTDRDLMAFIYSRSSLERKIDDARVAVDKHQKLIDEKSNNIVKLNNECEELRNNIQPITH